MITKHKKIKRAIGLKKCMISRATGIMVREKTSLSFRPCLRVSSAAGRTMVESPWPPAVLGHGRLAILDLSPAGHRPLGVINDLIKDQLEKKKDNRKLLWTLLVFQICYAKYKGDF